MSMMRQLKKKNPNAGAAHLAIPASKLVYLPCRIREFSTKWHTDCSHGLKSAKPICGSTRLRHGAPWVPIEGSSPWGITYRDL